MHHLKTTNLSDGFLAQLVEQWTENPCVPGSIPGETTKPPNYRRFFCLFHSISDNYDFSDKLIYQILSVFRIPNGNHFLMVFISTFVVH